MYALTAAGRAVQAQSHTAATLVQVLHGGRVVHEIVGHVVDGQVSADSDRPIMRNLQLTVVDPDGTLSASDVGDLLSPYDAEIRPWRGVVLPSGAVDMAPLGVFRLTNTEVEDDPEGVTVSMTGQDRALTYQTPLPGPVTIPAGTSVETAVRMLLSKVNGGLLFRTWVTGRTVGPLLYESDTQAWDAALTLAESVGGWLFHDRAGVCVFSPYASAQNSSLQRFDTTLLSVSRGEDADAIKNVVVVQSAESGTGVVRATAEDTDPDSPTFAKGSYGRRQITITNPHVGTPAMALEAAQAELVRQLGRSETVSWSCVPDVQTDPGDVVTVHRPRAGVTDRRVVVSSVELSLDVAGAMSVSGRKSIITQTGGDPMTPPVTLRRVNVISRAGNSVTVGVPNEYGGQTTLLLEPPYVSPVFTADPGTTALLLMQGPVPHLLPGDLIILGNPDGNHVRLDPAGLSVYQLDPIELTVGEVIRMGTGSTDFFAVTTVAGVTVASISSVGAASFSALTVNTWPVIGAADWTGLGGRLDTVLDRRPRGVVGYGSRAGLTTGTNTVDGIGYYEIVVDLLPGRKYKLQTSDIHIKSTVAGDVGEVRVMQTTAARGTLPASGTVAGGFALARAAGVAGTDVILSELMYPFDNLTVAATTRLLLVYARLSGTGLVSVSAHPNLGGDITMWVEDIGPSQSNRSVLNDGGSNGLGGAGGTPPTPPVQKTLTVTGSWTNAYAGDGDEVTSINMAWQGNTPLRGMRKAMIGFPELTQLVGATIQSVTLRLYAKDWSQPSGGTAVVGFHAYLADPTGPLTGLTSYAADVNRAGVWLGLGFGYIDLTGHAAQEWATGVKRGIYIGLAHGVTDLSSALSGRFAGALDADTTIRPELTFTYTV